MYKRRYLASDDLERLINYVIIKYNIGGCKK
jgi:hypothetical protein